MVAAAAPRSINLMEANTIKAISHSRISLHSVDSIATARELNVDIGDIVIIGDHKQPYKAVDVLSPSNEAIHLRPWDQLGVPDALVDGDIVIWTRARDWSQESQEIA